MKIIRILVSVSILIILIHENLHSLIGGPFLKNWRYYGFSVFICFIWYYFIYRKFNRSFYFSFFMSFVILTLITYYSPDIIKYQNEQNFLRAKRIVSDFESGKPFQNKYYWLGLDGRKYKLKKEYGRLRLSFIRSNGNSLIYDFSRKYWRSSD